MSVIECKKRDLVKINAEYVKELGHSLLEGKLGTITNAEGVKPKMKLGADYQETAFS